MKINQIPFLLIALSMCFSVRTAKAGYYFYVQFKDKKDSPYSVAKPQEFLSQRAVERRHRFNVPIDNTDLPVNPQYISRMSDFGIYVHCTTKWLNGVTVLVKDSADIGQIRALPFVKFVQYTGITDENKAAYLPPKAHSDYYDYGIADNQIAQMNGKTLHSNGYLGNGIHVAVIDAGFYGVNTNPAFTLLRGEGRLLGTKDFVNPHSDIFREDRHGAHVLSTMAAEINGVFVGTAPKASYLLIRTEAAEGEYLCEPDFWISGIEYADSAGVDVATTSLGYTTFDDAKMNYSYGDMDGKTARASIAATLAYKKGIMLLNAAGNEGNKSWRYIGAPADAEGVITVGSVTKDSVYSVFSSIGPTPDGRVKPELCAVGSASALVTAEGTPTYGNGTSFATPILAGLAACFLQAAGANAPHLALEELRKILFESAHLYTQPTPQRGYGIADFQKAYHKLIQNSVRPVFSGKDGGKKIFKIILDENTPKIRLNLSSDFENKTGILHIFNMAGQVVLRENFTGKSPTITTGSFAKGIYFVVITP